MYFRLPKYLLSCLIVIFVAQFVAIESSAADNKATFVVKKISIKGLIQHSKDTVFSHLSLKLGEPVDQQVLQKTTKELFKSGFFQDVQLFREGNELIIEVAERPWISEIIVSGNKLIKKEQLTEVLDGQKVAKNRSFNQEQFDKIAKEIQGQYYLQGYYGVKVATEAENLDAYRVRLKIQIFEGEVSRILNINLTGNKRFKQKDLLRLFKTRTYYPDAVFNSNDVYIRASLEGDFEKIKSFYLNHGHAKFRYANKHVALSPNHKGVFINAEIIEGSIYHFSGSKIIGYEKVLTSTEVNSLNQIKEGQEFSRASILDTTEGIRKKLQSLGYAYAQVIPIPDFDEVNKKVFMRINVTVGNRVYVRRIIFTGNNITLDRTIRKEMRQFEGALYVPPKVEVSKSRINRLGFFQTVEVQPIRINQYMVDLLVRVKEARTGSFNAQIGYSPSSGMIYKISVAENNWFGSGNQAKLAFDVNKNSEAVTLSYLNNNFTDEGLSLLGDVSYRRTDASGLSKTSYIIDYLSSRFMLGIPVNENTRMSYGAGFENSFLSCGSSFIYCSNYISRHSDSANLFSLLMSGNIDKRDRGLFPSSGYLSSFDLKLHQSDESYNFFNLTLNTNQYFALSQSRRNTLRVKVEASQVESISGELPFYKNLFTGGVYSVRGFANGSLGPSYVQAVDGVTGYRGGKFKTTANIDTYIAVDQRDEFSTDQDNFRLNFFIDSGYVFSDLQHFDSNQIRASVGAAAVYLTPIGIMSVFYAKPVRYETTDDISFVGFTLGHSL